MARILVAGGAGFIGSHLCDRLAAGPNEVVCVDDLTTGSRANLAHLEGKPNFFFQRHDVTKPLSIAGEVDEIFHLASPSSVRELDRRPAESALPNAVGTHHLLELARAKRARFVFASSAEVYGDPLEHPQREGYRGNVDATGPRGAYAESKRFGEAITLAYAREHALDAGVARIFNTYGPRMPDDGRAVSVFIRQAMAGAPITVYGDGAHARSFCFVADLVEGLQKLMASEECDPVNLGAQQETTVLELAKAVKRAARSASEIVHGEERPGEPARRCPDITRAKAVLGWAPRTPLEEGLRQTVEFFRKAPSRP